MEGESYWVGWVMAFCWRVTAVWARNRPFAEAPVSTAISVFERRTPSKCAVVPMETEPAVCQKMFFARAPPASVTRVALA